MMSQERLKEEFISSHMEFRVSVTDDREFVYRLMRSSNKVKKCTKLNFVVRMFTIHDGKYSPNSEFYSEVAYKGWEVNGVIGIYLCCGVRGGMARTPLVSVTR